MSGDVPAASERDWVYLANVRIPSEKAHVYQILQMVDALQRAGVQIELVHPRRANLPAVAGLDPVALYGLRMRPRLRAAATLDLVKLVTIDVRALNRRTLAAAAFALQMATFAASAALHVRRRGAAIIYGRDWPVLGVAAAVRPSARTFWEAHDLPGGRLARAGLRALLPRLAGVVAISEGLACDLAALGLPRERVLVAPDAVDLSRFGALPSKAAARARLGLPAEERMVVYTGHLYAWKGAHTLALASRYLPDGTRVYVVGGTPADEQAFRVFVAQERLATVRVVGYVAPAEVPVWLAAADVLALPNSARETISARYTSPLKLFEYLAAGRPIVASDLPSLREVLAHGRNAFLVAPDDAAALAHGISTVLADAALAARLAAEARRSVEGRTWEARARRIIDFVARAGRPAEDE